ncbi:MAG TPA: hypothetical protein PLX06_10080 [Fimbriimonadaceae bacterium]|nr:hypothetical protein [Fimbriimonadaceae bacterium]
MDKETLEFHPEFSLWLVGVGLPGVVIIGFVSMGAAELPGFLMLGVAILLAGILSLTVRNSNILNPRTGMLEVRRGSLWRQSFESQKVDSNYKLMITASLIRDNARIWITIIDPKETKFTVLAESTEKYSETKRRGEAVAKELGIPAEIDDSYYMVRREFNQSLFKNRKAWMVLSVLGLSVAAVCFVSLFSQNFFFGTKQATQLLLYLGILVGTIASSFWLPAIQKPIE